MTSDQEQACPVCGSSAVTEKGATVEYSGDADDVEKHWNYCINCGWSDA